MALIIAGLLHYEYLSLERQKIMEFREISLSNLDEIINLKVNKNQETLVADNLYSIAQAGLNASAWCRGVYVDGKPVGFFSVIDMKEKNKVYIWRFMIGQYHQEKGIGRQIMLKLLAHLFSDPQVELVDLTVLREIGGAEEFYKKCGFEATEEKLGNEWRMIQLSKDFHKSDTSD